MFRYTVGVVVASVVGTEGVFEYHTQHLCRLLWTSGLLRYLLGYWRVPSVGFCVLYFRIENERPRSESAYFRREAFASPMNDICFFNRRRTEATQVIRSLSDSIGIYWLVQMAFWQVSFPSARVMYRPSSYCMRNKPLPYFPMCPCLHDS